MLGDLGAVRVDELHVVRSGRSVVDHVSFAIAAGEITGLIGPSGSGKTTVMRSIVGVQTVAGGSVEVLGTAAGSPGLRARRLPDAVALGLPRPHRAREPPLLLSGARRAGRDPERVIAEVALGPHANDLVARLSGGEQSRVSLAVALLGTPELLVLDEPTVGLDPALRRDLWTLFGRLTAAGKTLVVSSHMMEEAARCDRLLLLRDGRLIGDGSPKALLEETGTATLEEAFLHLTEVGSS